MTRKDYIRIANAINESWKHAGDLDGYGVIEEIILNLCSELKQDNAAFQKDKLIEACKK